MLSAGLSPRVRGNHWGWKWRLQRMRSIPACAGEPAPQPLSIRAVEGLSPRVRGNHVVATDWATCAGSIPACAGEPPPFPATTSRKRVYPRVCGGTPTMAWMPSRSHGLSPRVRGNPDDGMDALPVPRSIPACAGEPSLSRSTTRSPKVYPRVCGGTLADHPGHRAGGGLSPRVRGNLAHSGADALVTGSIPACAGEPLLIRRQPPRSGVYPRVCGGTSRTSCRRLANRGLSPRVRGNPSSAAFTSAIERSIPACAGEPPSVAMRPAAVSGLSPRVRGNRAEGPRSPIDRGSIPACAGEPYCSA